MDVEGKAMKLVTMTTDSVTKGENIKDEEEGTED